MIVTSAKAIATTISTTSNAHIVIVAYACLIIQVLPIGIGIVTLIKRILILFSILTEFRECRTIHHRIFVKNSLEVDITIICYLGRRSHRALLRCDKDNTISTTRTVNSRCGSILQNIHRLDICWIDIRELAHERNSVKHNQRIV